MRASQFIAEAMIGTLNIDNIIVKVDSHAMDQCIDRMVLPTDVDRVLRKLPRIKDKLSSIDIGQQFWVYDPTLEVGLGCRMLAPEQPKIQFKTVIGPKEGAPFDSHVPVLTV
jgi:hypothetical protein